MPVLCRDLRAAIFGCVLCLMYILLSSTLITANKYLMDKSRFPHALALTTIHMLMSSFLTTTSYLLKPSLFPSMDGLTGKTTVLLKWMLPIGALFSVMLFGSNKAYLYCGVAFLQFMKETNVVTVCLISCAVGLQVMNRQRVFVIVWVMMGASLCIAGEFKFAWYGFMLQAASQLAESLRAVMAEWVLTSNDLRLDPLSYTLFVSPVSLLMLLFFNAVTWTPQIWADFHMWWHYLIPNACLAFALNVTVACVIKETSAIGFIIAGITKDVCLVVVSSTLMGETVTIKQRLGFVITISGVLFWSLVRVAPKSAPVAFFERCLNSKEDTLRTPNEATRLVATTQAPSTAEKI